MGMKGGGVVHTYCTAWFHMVCSEELVYHNANCIKYVM